MESVGYPPFFLYAVLAGGVALAAMRPYWAFLAAAALFGMTDSYTATLTRTELLGPFFNLYDVLFLVSGMSILLDRDSPPLYIPRPVEWLVLVLLMGSLTTAFAYEINYTVLRAIRWSITLPLAMVIGANSVVDFPRARQFLGALILGSAASAFQGIYAYRQLTALRLAETAARLPGALPPMAVNFLVAALQRPFFPMARWPLQLGWWLFLISCGLGVLITQWRAVFLGIALTLLILPALLKQWRVLKRSLAITLLAVPLLLIIFKIALPAVNPLSAFNRLSLLGNYVQADKAVPMEDQPRWRQIQRDVEEWSKVNWLIGRGLSFNAFLPDAGDHQVAWGHVGYAAYLSHFGLIGLAVFALYLPIQLFLAGKKLFLQAPDDPAALLGLLTMVSVVMTSITSWMSTSYLSPLMHTTGLLYGAAWSLAHGEPGALRPPGDHPVAPGAGPAPPEPRPRHQGGVHGD